jgi:PX domain
MYLAYDDWSPRYDVTSFFTVKLDGYAWITSYDQLENTDSTPTTITTRIEPAQQSPSPYHVNHNSNVRLPAYYYKIIIYRGHHDMIVYRRYSQFETLYQELLRHPPTVVPSSLSSSQQRNTTSTVIPHPLGGSDSDVCSFLGRRNDCFIRHLQGWNDLLWQLLVQRDNKRTDGDDRGLMKASTVATKRSKDLSIFLTSLLERGPEYANHIAVRSFLEL